MTKCTTICTIVFLLKLQYDVFFFMSVFVVVYICGYNVSILCMCFISCFIWLLYLIPLQHSRSPFFKGKKNENKWLCQTKIETEKLFQKLYLNNLFSASYSNSNTLGSFLYQFVGRLSIGKHPYMMPTLLLHTCICSCVQFDILVRSVYILNNFLLFLTLFCSIACKIFIFFHIQHLFFSGWIFFSRFVLFW